MSRCVLLTSWTIPSSKHSILALYSSLLLCSWTSEASGLSWWSYLFMMCVGGVGPCYLNPNSSGISSVGEVPQWGVDMSRTKSLLNKAITMITGRASVLISLWSVCWEHQRDEVLWASHHMMRVVIISQYFLSNQMFNLGRCLCFSVTSQSKSVYIYSGTVLWGILRQLYFTLCFYSTTFQK